MKTFTKILVPALALGGLAYVAYKRHEKKRHHTDDITIQSSYDPADMTYDDDDSDAKGSSFDDSDLVHDVKVINDLYDAFPKAVAKSNAKTDKHGNYKDMAELDRDLKRSMAKDHKGTSATKDGAVSEPTHSVADSDADHGDFSDLGEPSSKAHDTGSLSDGKFHAHTNSKGNLDHLFLPSSLTDTQESSVESIASDLSSVVKNAKSGALYSPKSSKSKSANSKGDQD